MLALGFKYIAVFLILIGHNQANHSVDHCALEWKTLESTAFKNAAIEEHHNCVYISYTKSLAEGFDTPSYIEVMKNSVILGSLQFGMEYLGIQGKLHSKNFRVLKIGCDKNFCQAIVTIVSGAGSERRLSSVVKIPTQSANSSGSHGLPWWKSIAEEVESSERENHEDLYINLGVEIDNFAGKRAAAFFMGEPVQPLCIVHKSLESTDWFSLQDRCPYNAADAINAGTALSDKGYNRLAYIFYLRGAADVRSPIMARTALNQLPETWSDFPASSQEFWACLKKTCEHSRSLHPICASPSIKQNDSLCFLK